MKKSETIDFFKGWSITTIVLFHLLGTLQLPSFIKLASNFGGAGVHIFFLCSGFGLYLSHIKKPMNFRNFVKRRLLKVHIPFSIVIIAAFILPVYGGSCNGVYALLGNLFLFKMFDNDINVFFGEQMWFVSTIMQFYLTFYLIKYFFEKFGEKKSLFFSIAMSLIWATIVYLLGYEGSRIWNSFFLQYLWEFILGMVLASSYINHNQLALDLIKTRYLIISAVVGTALLGIMGSLGGFFKLYNDIPSAVGYGSIALLFYRMNFKYLRNVMFFINKISYEWYLTHFLVFDLVMLWGWSIKIAMASFFLSIAVGLLLSKVLYRFQRKSKLNRVVESSSP